MPNYDYQCQECGHEFELFQSMNDKIKRKCPECKKNKLQRLFGSGAGLMFKGTGFYETDYKRSKPEKSESKSSKDSKTSKTDSKSN